MAETCGDEIGLWGQRYARYLLNNKRVIYYNILTSGKFHEYLADIDKQAQEMFNELIVCMKEQECITEKPKCSNMMEWAGKMNNIRRRASEVVWNKILRYSMNSNF